MTQLPPKEDFNNPTPNTQAEWKANFDLMHDYLTGLFTDAGTASSARSQLGLGTAAVEDAGSGANQLVQLDALARLPAVDGSQLTNIPSEFAAGTTIVFAMSSPPSGWSQTADNDRVLRVVNGGGMGTGGSVSIIGGVVTTSANGGHNHGAGSYAVSGTTGTEPPGSAGGGATGPVADDQHTHPFSASVTGSSASVGDHQHTASYNIKYQNVIFATKL